MSFTLPPIVKQAERLLLEIEKAVRTFPRYHKYACGAELRAQALRVCKIAHRAWRHQQQRAKLVGDLVFAIDDLKLLMQLASRLRAFASFAQFEMLSRIASDLGKQAGGWNQQYPSKVQNADAGNAHPQRDQILSTPAASIVEANA